MPEWKLHFFDEVMLCWKAQQYLHCPLHLIHSNSNPKDSESTGLFITYIPPCCPGLTVFRWILLLQVDLFSLICLDLVPHTSDLHLFVILHMLEVFTITITIDFRVNSNIRLWCLTSSTDDCLLPQAPFLEDVKRVLQVFVLFIPVPAFWALFDQQVSFPELFN